jgi:hypothetical protein
MTPRSPVEVYHRLWWMCGLRFQTRWVSQESNAQAAGNGKLLPDCTASYRKRFMLFIVTTVRTCKLAREIQWTVAVYSDYDSLHSTFSLHLIDICRRKWYTMCPQSPFGVLKNCGMQKLIELATCCLWQIIVKLWKFLLSPTYWHKRHLYVSESFVCEMATAGMCALCGMAFWDKISHPDSTKLPHTVQ